ncbi:hypothetical protein BDV96DRAFT_158278 [Lophiotrema nucula]|uniref:F-box domain-containing protein n=1 Tax=Lophiotrema nucula TaxID=690887 RepID=A0A6A5Z1U3_9PLEO|nr:hypothetical protein BDV96DRAFT_158278 [Lophiotrema nucula]
MSVQKVGPRNTRLPTSRTAGNIQPTCYAHPFANISSNMSSFTGFKKLLKRQPKANPKTAPNTGIGFLNLPGEIRNEIYQYLIFPNLQFIMIIGNTNDRCYGDSILQHPIFRMCRQVREEALSFLCANKEFHIYGVNSASRFLDYIGTAGRQSIANVMLCLVSHSETLNYDRLLRYIPEMTNLKSFHLRIDKDNWYAWGEDNGKAFLQQLQAIVNTPTDGKEAGGMTWQVVGRSHLTSEEGAILVTTRELAQILGEESHRYR